MGRNVWRVLVIMTIILLTGFQIEPVNISDTSRIPNIRFEIASEKRMEKERKLKVIVPEEGETSEGEVLVLDDEISEKTSCASEEVEEDWGKERIVREVEETEPPIEPEPEEEWKEPETEAEVSRETEPETEEVPITFGCFGRFEIPEFGFAVMLDHSARYDEKGYAAYILWAGGEIEEIADHNYQGFDVLYDCYVGCISQIAYEDGTIRTFECVKIDREAVWDDFMLWDSNGNDPFADPENFGLLITRTCNSEFTSNTLVYWKEF